MKLVLRSLIASHISTPIGDLAPGQTLTKTLEQNKFDAMSTELKSLEASGYITVTVQGDPSDKYSHDAVPGLLSTALNLYVDQTLGSDNNDGLSLNSALKSITAALHLIPQTVASTATINVKAGTYTEALNINTNFVPNAQGACKITIQGLDFVTATLTSITSGTIGTGVPLARTHTPALAATCKYPVAGASWTSNECKGKFINVTGGVSSFLFGLYPIAGNGSNYLEIPTTGIEGATFTIVDHAVELVAPDTQYTGITVSNNSGNVFNGVMFKNLRINTGSFYNAMINSGAVQFWGCKLVGASSLGIYVMSPHVSMGLYYSYLSGTQYSVYALGMNRLEIGGIVIEGGLRQIYIVNSPLNILDFYDICILQNAQFGFLCHAGPGIINEVDYAHFIVRNQSIHGVNLSGKSGWTAYYEAFNCVVGLHTRVLDEGEPNGGHRLMGTFMITDCTGDAIQLGGNHNYLGIQSGTISGNGGLGISINQDLHCSHNALSIESATVNFTMTANTGGDIKHTTAGSAATLAAYKTTGVTTDAPSLTRIDVA